MRQILIFIFACVCSLNVFSQNVYNYTFEDHTETHYVGGHYSFSGEITDTVCISTKQFDNVKTTKIAKGRWEINFNDKISTTADLTVYDENNKKVVYRIYNSNSDGLFLNVANFKSDDRTINVYTIITDCFMCSVAVSNTFGCIDIIINKDNEAHYNKCRSYSSFINKYYSTNENGITTYNN